MHLFAQTFENCTLPSFLRRLLALTSLLLLSGPGLSSEAPIVIKHARHDHTYLAQRENYFLDLLKLALDKSGIHYRLQAVPVEPHSEYRSIQYLRSEVFDVKWLNTSKLLEETLLPVRIPLFKGMIGWRLFIIREEDQNKFSKLHTLNDLNKFIALQGYSWPDTQILRAAGLKVDTATDFISLSVMLERKRGDYFPRGLTEAYKEIENYEGRGFAVEKHLILHYPAAYYFFVRKEQVELAAHIQRGLEIAVNDGSFDAIFWPYFDESIEKARLSERRILSLPNPTLPNDTPLNEGRYWFSLENLQQRDAARARESAAE